MASKGDRLRAVVREFLATGDWWYDMWDIPHHRFKEPGVTPINRESREPWLPALPSEAEFLIHSQRNKAYDSHGQVKEPSKPKRELTAVELDVISAIVNLGAPRSKAKAAVEAIGQPDWDLEKLFRAALEKVKEL